MVYLYKDSAFITTNPLVQRGTNNPVFDFQCSFRKNAINQVSFSSFQTSLEIGKLYYVYATPDIMLPATFILLNKTWKTSQLFNMESGIYSCEGIGALDLLGRKTFNPVFRNKSFGYILSFFMEKLNAVIPELSTDMSYVSDYDEIIPLFAPGRGTLINYISEFEILGFQVYLRPDLKIGGYRSSEEPVANVEFYNDGRFSLLNNKMVILNGWECSKQFEKLPATKLYIQGAIGASGEKQIENFTGDGETSIFKLSEQTYIADNFISESFDSLSIEEASGESLTGVGWEQRYRIYDQLIDTSYPISAEINLELIDFEGKSYLIALSNGSDLSINGVTGGFYIDNTRLKSVNNGIVYDLGIDLKPYIERTVIEIQEKTVEINDSTGLEVGDIITILALNSTIGALQATITNINGNILTLDSDVLDDTFEDTKLIRVNRYKLSWRLNSNTITYYCNDNKLSSFIINEAQFLVLYNNYNGSLEAGEGITEVGNLALNKALISLNFRISVLVNGETISLVNSELHESFSSEAVVRPEGEVEFISPSIVSISTGESTLTTIPIVIGEDDYIAPGMRILINGVENFVKSTGENYIELETALESTLEAGTLIRINTTIPALGDQISVTYEVSRQITIKLCLGESEFGYREETVTVSNQTIEDIVAIGKQLLEQDLSPTVTGRFEFVMSDLGNSYASPFFELPAPGQRIQVTYKPSPFTLDASDDITEENVIVQSITIDQEKTLEGINDIKVKIEFGNEKKDVATIISSLKKSLTNSKESDINYNIPCLMQDDIAIQEYIATNVLSSVYFFSGTYKSNYSGNALFNDPSENLVISLSASERFFSGQYRYNYSGI
jgi:hypothetical protein